MRDIKFRAWDKKKKIMVHFEHPEICDEYAFLAFSPKEEKYNNICGFVNEGIEFEPLILMQYTGLKDKNGKEIYDGDILKQPSEIYRLFVVEWDKFRWKGIWRHKKADVIGNIYENPELLKGE